MKFLIRLIIIGVASHFALMHFPWWSIALCGFIAGALLNGSHANSFFSGFVAVGALWLVKAFMVNTNSEGILSAKIAQLIGLESGVMLVLITALIGAMVGGFATLSGLHFRKLFERKKSSNLYK